MHNHCLPCLWDDQPILLYLYSQKFNMKFRITYYLNLYHHFGKGLYECWIL